MTDNKLQWGRGKNIDIDIINETEKFLKIKFPKSYKKTILNADGGLAMYSIGENDEKLGIIKISDRNRSTILLRKCRKLEGYEYAEIIDVYYTSREILPEKFIPFAYDSGGNDYIFDYSISDEPRICYLHHEESISIDDVDEDDLEELSLEELQKEPLIYLANSFDEFIEKIYPGEN